MARLDARWGNFRERGQAWDHFWQDAAAAGGGTTTYTYSGSVALTFGVAAIATLGRVGSFSDALVFTVTAAASQGRAASGDVGLAFGISAPHGFTPVSVEAPPSSGGGVWRPTQFLYMPASRQTPVVHFHRGRGRLRLTVRAAASHAMDHPGSAPAPSLRVVSRRTFIRARLPSAELDEELLVALGVL